MFKYVFIAIFSMTSFASETLSKTDINKIDELENRILALEKAMETKLGNCEMKYLRYGIRHNTCPRGTFARSVRSINTNLTELECGYYQLNCSR